MKVDFKSIIIQFGLVIVIILVLVVAVVARTTGGRFFKPDAFKHALPTISGSEMISVEKAGMLPGNKIIINLDNRSNHKIPSASIVNYYPDSILDKNCYKLISDNNGPVILYSTDLSVSARIWMILAQKGIDNLYILTPEDDEVSKNKFRSDTGSNRN